MKEFEQFIRGGRITSMHGILLPPKKRLVASKYITIRFVLTGTIPSKKNMIWADSNLHLILRKLYAFKVVKECIDWLRINLKAYIRNSQKYKAWVEEARLVINKQALVEFKRYREHGIQYPLNNVTVKVYHYWADDIERDLTNKLDSINDLLVDCGIIVNDNWQVLRKIESEGQNYKGEILQPITTIDITQRLSSFDPSSTSESS